MPACSHCGNDCAPDAKVCPRCGKQQPTAWVGCLIAVIIGLIVLAALSSDSSKSNKTPPTSPPVVNPWPGSKQ